MGVSEVIEACICFLVALRTGGQVHWIAYSHHHEVWQRDCGNSFGVWRLCQYPWCWMGYVVLVSFSCPSMWTLLGPVVIKVYVVKVFPTSQGSRFHRKIQRVTHLFLYHFSIQIPCPRGDYNTYLTDRPESCTLAYPLPSGLIISLTLYLIFSVTL